MKKQIKKESGFNLVELMVVIGTTAMLLAAGVPASRSWLTSHKSRQTLITLFTNMKSARTRAITENVNFIVTFNVGNNTYQILRDDDGSNSITAGDTDILGGVQSLNELNVILIQVGVFGGGVGNQIMFQPDGSLTNGLGGSVTLTSTMGKIYTINVSGPTGRIKII